MKCANLNKIYVATFVLAILMATVYAASAAADTISQAVCSLYNVLKSLLPIIGFVLFVLAGVAYAAGNFFGAEMKSKAQGWGMTALVAGIIMLVILLMAPLLITALYPSTGFGTSPTGCPLIGACTC